MRLPREERIVGTVSSAFGVEVEGTINASRGRRCDSDVSPTGAGVAAHGEWGRIAGRRDAPLNHDRLWALPLAAFRVVVDGSS